MHLYLPIAKKRNHAKKNNNNNNSKNNKTKFGNKQDASVGNFRAIRVFVLPHAVSSIVKDKFIKS